jgi:nucleoside-diphosphate-sugar epimerase
MRVFLTGATGFIGRALIPRLQRDGHGVVAWVRSPAGARGLLGADVELVHADTAPDGWVAAIERSDAVVNLAGEPLMGGRWTAARRAVLEDSRIAVTEQLVRAMAEAKSRPRVFISGSAVGYYGDRTVNCSRKRPAPPTIFWHACASGGSAPPRKPTGWARVSCCYELGLFWVGPAVCWRKCCRCSSCGSAGPSDRASSTCRGFISTIP